MGVIGRELEVDAGVVGFSEVVEVSESLEISAATVV